MTTPKFADLPKVPGTEERHAWDVWGRADNLGSLNRVGAGQIREAARLVTAGDIIPLTLPLNEPSPGIFPDRTPYRHVVERTGLGRDDHLDNLFLQFSSQWDGLRHVRFREHGYWGGRGEDDLEATGDLGIDLWSRRGPMGRGVLIDVARYFERQGTPLAPDEPFEITGELIETVAAAEGTDLRSGDFLVMRTGWMEWYLSLPEASREKLGGGVGNGMATPGLDSSRQTAEFLWDKGIVSVAADNIACETLPVNREKGFLHYRMIPLLGMAIGEFWHLEEISRYCADSDRYSFFLVSAALRIPRGVGSPANAYAIF